MSTDLAKVIAYNENSQDATTAALALDAKFRSEGFTSLLVPSTRARLMADLRGLNFQPTYYRTLPTGRLQKIDRVVLIGLNADRATYEYLEFNPGTLEMRNVYDRGARVVNRVMIDGVEVVTRIDEVKYHEDAVVSRQVALVTAYDIGLENTNDSDIRSEFRHLNSVHHHFLTIGARQTLFEWINSWENL
jgi:hypothetical protein